MVNPGAFSATRKEFLASQKPLYAEAHAENHVADTVADIQRRYFKRYPISLPHTEEPSTEWLAQVDDNGPDPDLLPPDEAVLDEEAFEGAQLLYESQVKLLKFRKDQITRRLAYQYAKDQNPTKHISIGSEDPMTVLMTKLAGIPMKKPRLRTAYNVWAQHNREVVDTIYEERSKMENVPATKRAALRQKVYKECFGKLKDEEKTACEALAVEERDAAIEKMELSLNGPPSTDPVDRQQVLKGLPSFVQPILDLISDYTGWKATLLVGGPEPADQGRLNIMSFHSGETTGNIKMNFGRSERCAYKTFVTPIFGTFLKKCYTVEDCRAAALSDATTISLAEVLRLDGGDSYSVETVESATSYVKVANARDLSETGSSSPVPQSTLFPTPVAPSLRPSFGTSLLNSDVLAGSPIPSPRISPAPPLSLKTSTTIRESLIPSLSLSLRVSPVPPLSEKINNASQVSPVPSPGPSPCASPALSSRSLSESISMRPISLSTTAQHPLISQAATSKEIPLRSCSPTPPAPPLPTTERVIEKRPHVYEHSDDESAAERRSPLRKRLRSSRDMPVRKSNDAIGVGSQLDTPSSAAVQDSSHTPTPPLTPKELAQCPDWFLKVYQMLLSKDLGTSWTELVRTWAHFEKKASYEEKEKLGTAGRPACIGAWISRARAATYRPNLGTLPIFEKDLKSWWVSLQPEWQQDGSNDILKRDGSDLEDLRRPGKNGLVSVLAALFFWAAYAETKGGEGWKLQWQNVADDVHWVIHSLNTPD